MSDQDDDYWDWKNTCCCTWCGNNKTQMHTYDMRYEDCPGCAGTIHGETQ